MLNIISPRYEAIPSVISFVLSRLPSSIRTRFLIQLFVFEILRRRLPSFAYFISSSLFGVPSHHTHTSNTPIKTQQSTKSPPAKEPKTLPSPADTITSTEDHHPHKALERVKVQFFKKNWSEISKQIREEVVHLFNIEKQLYEVNRNLNIQKKTLQWDAIKTEMWCFLPFSIVSTTLIITTQFLQEVLKVKYIDLLEQAYPALHDPKEIAHSILHEFFEQLQLVGLKNLKGFFKHKLTKPLTELPISAAYDIDGILALMDDYFFNELLKGNSIIKKPSDHKKRSSMTLFRNNGNTPNNNSKRNHKQLPPPSLIPTNTKHPFWCHKQSSNSSAFKELSNTAILAHTQPIVTPNAMLDIMQFFLGDIEHHKILTDTEFIEQHIEIVDCRCREQRYYPSLSCIPEAEDDTDGGYESDQSDSHEQYQIILPFKTLKSTNHGGSPRMPQKRRKASYEKQIQKQPRRRVSSDFCNEKHEFQEDFEDFDMNQKKKNNGIGAPTAATTAGNSKAFVGRKKDIKTRTQVLMKEEEKYEEDVGREDDRDSKRDFASLKESLHRAVMCIDGEEEDYQPKNSLKLEKGSSAEESIEIAENRTRLASFLSSLCFEALEIMESASFQTYLYYTILFQYKKFKNRLRSSAAESSGGGSGGGGSGSSARSGSNMMLINIIGLINRVLDAHILSEDAQSRCESVYTKAKADAEKLAQSGAKITPQSANAAANIARIFEEMHQSRIVRESFDELAVFFMSGSTSSKYKSSSSSSSSNNNSNN